MCRSTANRPIPTPFLIAVPGIDGAVVASAGGARTAPCGAIILTIR